MITFKQYYNKLQTIEENRRTFLKTLFGTGAAGAVSNPVAVADTIAKQAGLPWIELKLFTGQSLAPYAAFSVDATDIDALKSQQGMIPGVNKSGDIMIDYNNSDLGEMTVYVKPGSKIHAQARGLVGTVERGDHDFSLENSLDDDVQQELGKAIHDTINDFDGDGSTWLEQEIEKEQERYISEFEELPDWQKDEREDVDGIDEDSYPAEAQKGATDNANRFINQGVKHFGAEIGEPIKNVVGRGYMKSYALGAGGGDESTMIDSMADLRDVYGDDEIDHPDEDDVYRWMEGEADDPYDTYNDGRADWKDDYEQDMDQVQGTGEYEQPEGTGLDTSWDDGMGNVLSLAQVLAHAGRFPDQHPKELEHLMIPTERDPARVQAADTSEPLLIAYDGMKPIKILDGQHRLQKALNTGLEGVPINRVDINSDPKLKQMFDPEPEPDENI